mmetsp:Transcript_18922/g.53760  ORF Transcript_18922/g.53760 Transcript_18922/m.53760 type:complete len:219 (+) Transcript_18922:1182-1838(+)
MPRPHFGWHSSGCWRAIPPFSHSQPPNSEPPTTFRTNAWLRQVPCPPLPSWPSSPGRPFAPRLVALVVLATSPESRCQPPAFPHFLASPGRVSAPVRQFCQPLLPPSPLARVALASCACAPFGVPRCPWPFRMPRGGGWRLLFPRRHARPSLRPFAWFDRPTSWPAMPVRLVASTNAPTVRIRLGTVAALLSRRRPSRKRFGHSRRIAASRGPFPCAW